MPKRETNPAADRLEERVLAFAEQLGRIAGTVHARAESWVDRRMLYQQIAAVRDGAAELLRQLGRPQTEAAEPPSGGSPRRGRNQGRSGGVVDAPGKKHRKPAPPDPEAKTVSSQAAKIRVAKPMTKTNRHRGRG